MDNCLLIELGSIKRVKDFVHSAESFSSDIDAMQGRFRVAATSVMGMFSLNLMEPIKLILISEDEEEIKRFFEVFKDYQIKED